MITIDGYDIFAQWTLAPVYGGLYNELGKFPAIKERDTNDWPDRNGIEVDLTDAVYKHREMTFQFFCNTYAKYKEFIAYVKAHQNFNLYDSHTDRTYSLEYMDCSDFNDSSDHCTFAVRVRECKPFNLD